MDSTLAKPQLKVLVKQKNQITWMKEMVIEVEYDKAGLMVPMTIIPIWYLF
jgi:hypothetical protein